MQESGVIGNLDNDMTVRNEQCTRPELAHLLHEFEHADVDELLQHEQYLKFQCDFKVSKDFFCYIATLLFDYVWDSCQVYVTNVLLSLQDGVLAMVEAFEQLGNPFLEDSGQLLDLDQSIIMPQDVIDNVRNVKSFGDEKYKPFYGKKDN